MHTLDKELRKIKSQIVQEKENIHILNAEYTYLASPKRVKSLVENNFDMQILKKEQILSSIELADLLKKYENEIVSAKPGTEQTQNNGARSD